MQELLDSMRDSHDVHNSRFYSTRNVDGKLVNFFKILLKYNHQ